MTYLVSLKLLGIIAMFLDVFLLFVCLLLLMMRVVGPVMFCLHFRIMVWNDAHLHIQ